MPQTKASLIKLSDSGHTVAAPDEDVRGRDVKDKNGEDVGKVDDLLIDEAERKVRFLLVSHGGFLGLGETKSFIPVDAITRIDDDVHIDRSGEQVAGGPRYDPEVAVEPEYYDDLYGYYGVTPYWGAGYVYPPYPFNR